VASGSARRPVLDSGGMDSTGGYLTALLSLSDGLVWSEQLDESIVQTLGPVKIAAQADLALVYLLDSHQESLTLVAEESERLLLADYEVLPASTYARLPLLTRTLRPVVIADLLHPDAEDFLPKELELELEGWMSNGAVVPLVADHRLLGMLCLSFRLRREWTEDRIEFLAALGRILGSAIYHAQVAARVQELAALEERRLISRELHDGVSQDVSALSLRVAAASEACASGDIEELRADLGHVSIIALQIQKELRDEMVGLRSSSEENEEAFVTLVQSCLERFEEQWFIPVAFECAEPASLGSIPMRVSMQLLRVVQEALSNTRLHAGADGVVVRLLRRGSKLRLEIEDDGTGFDRDEVPQSRLGLRIMQERIEQIGGRLAIESGSGRGTCVRAEVPLPAGS
jgi:signal transduction histidine kinase